MRLTVPLKKLAPNSFWLAIWLAFTGCLSVSPPTLEPPTVAPTSTGDLTRVRGRVLQEGRSSPSDITIGVARVPDEVVAETLVQGLEVPWELAFAPDGRIFVTERPGRIRVVQGGVLQATPFATLEQVVSVSESGLMGLALHPEFAENGQLFVCYTYRNERGDLRNRVARLTDDNGRGTGHQVVFDDMPGAQNHNGCRLAFGPDEKLYVTMGDAQESSRAQDLDSPSGKVLRLEPDGSVPPDNPFSGSPVYTYGHRNPQGIAWHPTTGDLFVTEHGPDRDDEINILEPGGNYGWPEVTGASNASQYSDPIQSFTPTTAVAGAAFYSGDTLAASWDGNLVFANLRGAHLQRVVLEPPDFRTVASRQVLLDQEFGRLRAVALSPDGFLYVTTSNRDGRGSPQPGDDRVLRLVPAPSGPPEIFQPDQSGDFTLDLEPGTYQISWVAPGFIQTQRTVVVTGTGGIDLGEIQLSPGEVTGNARAGPDHLSRAEASSNPALFHQERGVSHDCSRISKLTSAGNRKARYTTTKSPNITHFLHFPPCSFNI